MNETKTQLRLEAFNAESVCGNTRSESFPIIRESGVNVATGARRIDLYLTAPFAPKCLEIVQAVNSHSALLAVAEVQKQAFRVLVEAYSNGTPLSLDQQKLLADMMEPSLSTLATLQKATE